MIIPMRINWLLVCEFNQKNRKARRRTKKYSDNRKKKGGKEKKPLAVRLFTVSRCVFHVARVSFNNQTRAGRTMQFNAGDSAHRYRDETSRIPRRRRLPSNDNARIAQNAQLSKKHRAPTVFFFSLSLSLSKKNETLPSPFFAFETST